MNNKKYSITLADGTILSDLRMNGSYYISEKEIDPSVFEDNCSPVTISDGEDYDIYEYMSLSRVRKVGDEYWFVLREVTASELESVRYEAMLRYITTSVDDESATTCIDIFPVWTGNSHTYTVGDRIRYGKQLYKCTQAHTSQASWSPAAAPSLWARMDDPSVEWPEWVQPTGAHDSYAAGYKVSHNGSHWVSDVDNNSWEPGVYGWTKQEG